MNRGIKSLIGVYDSNEVDIVESFYLPLFSCADRVDRMSCYFSSKALSTYSHGLEEFGRKPYSKYRLIVSTDISKDDFDAMVEGEGRQKEIDSILASKLRETLTIDEESKLSNLARLIELGVVEIRIAYVRNGIFHYKMGYAEDSIGDSIFFMGSNNETEAAIIENYEMFTVVDGINEKHRFEDYWNNNMTGVKVMEPSNLIWEGIQHFNKGKLIDPHYEEPPDNCIFLDYDRGEIILENFLSNSPSNYNLVQLSRIGRHVESYAERITFKTCRNYIDCEQIIKGLKNYCSDKCYAFVVSRSLSNYIDRNNLIINQRCTLGLDIKRHDRKVATRYEGYKSIVDSCMIRKLRDMQMWDSFFMYSMKKAGNFSVPGSGKTSSALGVFAYLKHFGEVKRLIIIGPLNCFDSWIGEYEACFGQDGFKFFDARYNPGNSADAQINNLLSTYASRNMFLFNYDSLSKYSQTIRDYLVDDSLLIFDEAHYVKGVTAHRSKQALIISEKSSRTIIMTGTPMPNSYVDLYNPLHILFPSEYNSYFGYTTSMLVNPSESVNEDINKKFQPFFCRTSKDSLGVRPANPDIDVDCHASESEIRLYAKILDSYKNNRLALIVRMLQMESDSKMLIERLSDVKQYFSDDFSDSNDTPMLDLAPTIDADDIICREKISTKTKCCIELVKKLVSEGKKVIVWCIFTRSIDNISSLLESYGISNRIIYGSTSSTDRTSTIDLFKNGSFSVLVTNPHTLAESISLHMICHDAVYFEYSYNLVHLLQSKDRIHRLGLPENQYTQYYFIKLDYDIISKDGTGSLSLDNLIYQRLKDKEETMNQAISSGRLEQTSTSEEDIDQIYRKMGWD